ncbi:MAG: radical SAM protein [Candidatus Aminicenantes bacterium]|nr:radical SAM protein [Candidatus Aminicenantes bacterium]
MSLNFPFDPLKRSEEVECLVTRAEKRSYYRFRPAPYYGGIATADAVGCSFLCAYCWNYNRNLNPERFREFYSPQQVASKLLHIAKKKSFRFFRISGAEPVLGERTFQHLTDVLRLIFQSKPDSLFILETNGFFLGYRPDLLGNLQPYPNLRVRICLKGSDEESFEKITGAKRDFFRYPMIALKELERLGVRAWPALMGDLFSREEIDRLEEFLREQGIQAELEQEFLETYPFVLDNMRKRNLKFNH